MKDGRVGVGTQEHATFAETKILNTGGKAGKHHFKWFHKLDRHGTRQTV